MKCVFALLPIFLVVLGGCSPKSSTSEADLPAESVTIESAAPSATHLAEDDISLITYDHTSEGIPITARYPDTMHAESTASSEGIALYFTFNPDGDALDQAELHVFLPAGTATAADHEPFVTGPNGLMENNGWVIQAQRTPQPGRFFYPWVVSIIDFTAGTALSGHVLLGQADGQALQVSLLYPDAAADAYWLAVHPVLDSLAITPRSDLSTSRAGGTPATATAAAHGKSDLAGSSWSLIEIASMDDSVARPAAGARYELTFEPDGRLQVQADCNRGQGSWQETPPRGLVMGAIATTRMACPPQSLDARFLSDLEYVRSYVMKDGHLYLATMADGSILEFQPFSQAGSSSE